MVSRSSHFLRLETVCHIQCTTVFHIQCGKLWLETVCRVGTSTLLRSLRCILLWHHTWEIWEINLQTWKLEQAPVHPSLLHCIVLLPDGWPGSNQDACQRWSSRLWWSGVCQVLWGWDLAKQEADQAGRQPEDGLPKRRRQQKNRPLFSDIWSSPHCSQRSMITQWSFKS